MEIILLAIGIFVGLLGVLVWRGRALNAVAGYDEQKTKDKEGLARWIGTSLLWMGVLMAASAGAGLLWPGIPSGIVIGVWIISVLIFSVRAVLGSKRFEMK